MKILISDDDPSILLALKQALASEHEVESCLNLNQIETNLIQFNADVLLCDYDFGNTNLTQYLKINDVKRPIIVMSGKATKENLISLVNAGICGYIEKPFSIHELKQCIQDVCKKFYFSKKPQNLNFEISVLESIGVQLHREERSVSFDNQKVKMTPIEYKLLNYFIENANKTLRRDEIEKHIWPNVTVSKNTLDTHVGNLKKKIGPLNQALISIYGEGYILKTYDI